MARPKSNWVKALDYLVAINDTTHPAQALPLTRSPTWLPQSAFWPLSSASAPSGTYPDPQRAHTGTKDALNNEVKIAFGQGDLSWKPGHCAQPTEPSAATALSPKT